MKKIFSKAMALIMAAALCVGMCATAFAAAPTTTTGSITINNLEPGVTATAYQIAKATYDSEGNFLGYEMTVTVPEGGFTINSDGTYDESKLTEDNLAALYKSVGDAAGSATADKDLGETSATITNLPVGSYLIVITNSESVTYAMMIGSVSYAVDEGSWTIDNGEITVTTEATQDNLWAKGITPTIGKTEHHDNSNPTHGESTNVGDEITFDITISNIPYYAGDYPEFDVDDTLTGLTISDTELDGIIVRVMNGETEVTTLVKGEDYTVTRVDGAANEFDVNFVVDGSYTLNGYANQGYTIVIEYQATVSDDAEYTGAEAEYDNDVVLNYSTTSYESGNEGHDNDKDYEYSFELDIHKTESNGTTPLAGATFALYTDKDCETEYTQNGQAVTATSGEDGKFTFKGLKEGTYYMKETEAPAGYLLSTEVYTVNISATYNEVTGEIINWSIVITDAAGDTIGSTTGTSADAGSSDTNATIKNYKAGELPNTGGMGTTIFYVIGGVLVAGAVVVLVTRRRMTRES